MTQPPPNPNDYINRRGRVNVDEGYVTRNINFIRYSFAAFERFYPNDVLDVGTCRLRREAGLRLKKVDSIEHHKVMALFFKLLVEELLFHGERVRLPHHGWFQITRFQPKRRYIDRGALFQKGEMKDFDNSHTDNFILSVDYTPDRRFFPGSHCYTHKLPTRVREAFCEILKTVSGHYLKFEICKKRHLSK